VIWSRLQCNAFLVLQGNVIDSRLFLLVHVLANLLVHYSRNEETPFRIDMLGMLRDSDRIVKVNDKWMKAPEAKTEDSEASGEFDTRGVELILRGVEEQWNLELDSIRQDLPRGCIGITGSSNQLLKKDVCEIFDWRPVLPDMCNQKDLRPLRHIQLLRSGVILDNLVDVITPRHATAPGGADATVSRRLARDNRARVT
jgi:hypothetical protein